MKKVIMVLLAPVLFVGMLIAKLTKNICELMKDNVEVSRQEVAFLKKSRKIKDCGSLKEDFYTRFKPEVNDGAGAWLNKYVNVIKT